MIKREVGGLVYRDGWVMDNFITVFIIISYQPLASILLLTLFVEAGPTDSARYPTPVLLQRYVKRRRRAVNMNKVGC